MYSFKNDYSELAHPEIIEALLKNSKNQFSGYGEDQMSIEASQLIKALIQNQNSEVHFVSGGTQANALAAIAFLKPFEAIIAADTAHILVHEAGAIEATGHKILSAPHLNGKLKTYDIESLIEIHTDEHMVKPRMVYISQSTELGTLYSREEIIEISEICKAHDLLFYIDGARLGSAMYSSFNNLTWKDLSHYTDAFYIGGTKNGALFGEAIVINNPNLQEDFRFYLKRMGALLAKGSSIGIQFYTLFKDQLFQRLAEHANQHAEYFTQELKLKNIEFWMPPQSNQIFPILNDSDIKNLEKEFGFYVWKKINENQSIVRLVCSWASNKTQIDRFVSFIALNN